MNRAEGYSGPVRHVIPVGIPASIGNSKTTGPDVGRILTSAALTAGATFTGDWEQNDAPDVQVSCKSDVAGTLYFDFSNDGTNVDTFPPSGFTVSAGVHEYHVAVKGPRFFRVRYVNGGSNQSYLRLFTYYGTFRQGNAPISFTIADDADAIVVKSVISGVGDTTVKVTDHQALQVTPPPEGKTAFGEAVVAEPRPIIQMSFPYDINTAVVEKRENQSGTVTHAARQANVASGAAANSSAEMKSLRALKYNPGQGVAARFTAVFTAGVANSTQIVGMGDESDGVFFGYNGTSFGVLHRRNGAPEIRTLTVSTASTTAENITITLDGDATATVAVTNTGNATLTANEIAAHDYSDVGTGWTAKALGNKVEFKSWDAATHDGTFSLSGASTAVGTFAQNVVGTAPSETWIAQASWNGADKFDGTGLTGVTLDPTTGNVYQIKYQWLGYGLMTFYIEDPDDGELHLVHAIEYANANTTPSMGDPSLPIMAKAENTSNTSSVVIKIASAAAFIEGAPAIIGVRRGARGFKTTVTTSALPILSVRQGQHFNSKAVQTFSKMMRLAVAVDHVKPITISLIEDGTLTSASWASIDAASSSLQYDTAATAITGGKEIWAIPLGQTGSELISYVDDYFAHNLRPGQVLTFAATANSGSGGEANVSVEMLERL